MNFTKRLTVLAGAFLALFSVLALRLWFVQVAQGEHSERLVEEQTWLTFATQAPRGDILDRRGELLATNRYAPALLVDRRRLAPEQRPDLVQALSSLLELPPDQIDLLYEEAGPNGRFRVAVVDTATAYLVNEEALRFPGVSIERVPLREYQVGTAMAHVVGHLGLPDEDDLAAEPSLDPNARIGKLGVERTYDEYLRGTAGEYSYQINRRSEIIAERPEIPANQGNSLYLTLDLRLQQVVEAALDDAISLANQIKAEIKANGGEVHHRATRGAVVVLDTRSGAVMALASRPAFDPQLFVGGLHPSTFESLNAEKAFLNLAVSGLYPPASTFKAITYVTKLEEDIPLVSPNADGASGVVNCNGLLRLPGFDPGSPQIFKDWYYPRSLGWLDLHEAFENSCNIYFYSVALGVWSNYKNHEKEDIIQDWARSLGYGTALGIDLPGERPGIVPDRELFAEWMEYQLAHPLEPRRLDPARFEFESPWLGGDLMNFAIGQGSFVATPLQVAASYAAIVNGGTLWRPYVVDRVVSREGEVVAHTEPAPVSTRALAPSTVSSILADLGLVTRSGTAAAAFADFGTGWDRVGGKTGTSQPGGENDNHAMFVGVLPLDNPTFVVAVVVEEGGSGGQVAAPAGRHIMQYLVGGTPTPIVAGEETD